MIRCDDTAERAHLLSLTRLLLDRSFGDEDVFDHGCMSAGEGLGTALEHMGVARFDGSELRLDTAPDQVMRHVAQAPLSDLPALIDLLDVTLSFVAQYGTVPQLTRGDLTMDFDAEMAAILTRMDLLDDQGCARPAFLPIAINHYFITPAPEGWHDTVAPVLQQLCKATMRDAPEAFRDLVAGRADRPASNAEGVLRAHWRYGHWLSDTEQARALDTGHPFLPAIIAKTLILNEYRLWLPTGRRTVGGA